MKNWLWLAAVCAVFCAVTVLCNGCGEDEKAAAKKTFTVGFDADFKPYGYRDQNEYKGFDLDLAREVCKRNNWEIVLRPINWDAKDHELNSGSIDCIWNGFTINGRETSYEWSEPYVDNSQVVLVKKDSAIKTLADLKGKKVAVQADTPVLEALSAKGKKESLGATFSKLVVTPNYNNAVMELESGAVEAVAMDIGVANEKVKAGAFRILDEVIITEKYGIGFKKGNTSLRDAVQTTLKMMIKDGTAAKISAQYFEGKNIIIMKP